MTSSKAIDTTVGIEAGMSIEGVQEVEEAGKTSIMIITEVDPEVVETTTVAIVEIQHGKEIETVKAEGGRTLGPDPLLNAVDGSFTWRI